MKFEDIFIAVPCVATVGGVVAYSGFDVPLTKVAFWTAVVSLSPYALMAALILVVWVFFGGFNNDRPACSCGRCTSSQYSFDELLTRQRNRGRNPGDPGYEFCYRCPACETVWVSREKVFYRLNGGELTPYRRQNYWGRWKPVA